MKKRRDVCHHFALATFTPETVGELEFGGILNCYEPNRLPENLLLFRMKTAIKREMLKYFTCRV